MAIRMMTSKEKAGQPNVETVTNYPGHETDRIHHHWKCPHRSDSKYIKERGPECHQRCQYNDPLYMETTYVGCVLEKRERNGYDDSDFYANVWDEATQSVIQIEYASTRGWTYPNGASVDATDEVLEKVKAYYAAIKKAKDAAEAERQAKLPLPGRTVQVVRGRKIKKGVAGEVFWRGPDKYDQLAFDRRHKYNPYASLVSHLVKHRIGLMWVDADGITHKEFTAESNVLVINKGEST